MTDDLPLLAAIVAYAIAAVLIWLQLHNSEARSNGIKIAIFVATIAAILHTVGASHISFHNEGLNLSFQSMGLLVSAILVWIYLAGTVFMPIHRLGVLVFPITALVIIFALSWSNQENLLANSSTLFTAHIIISILSYCLIALAALQALLYWYQERQIKNRRSPYLMLALPPLQTMELFLFRMTTLGFVLLTLTLLSGVVFSQQIFSTPFTFTHHTLFALLGWLVFACLLFRRFKYGLNGSSAAVWIWAGFLLIQLGYFGTKLVSESLT